MNKLLVFLFLFCWQMGAAASLVYLFYLAPPIVGGLFLILFALLKKTPVFSSWSWKDGIFVTIGSSVLGVGASFLFLSLLFKGHFLFILLSLVFFSGISALFFADLVCLLTNKKESTLARSIVTTVLIMGLMALGAHRLQAYPCTLMVVADHGQSLVLRFLILTGFDPDAPDCEHSPLAKGANHLNVVQVLLDQGANPNRKQKWGRSALHNTGGRDQVQIAKLLIRSGAKVNAMDHNGRTPLLTALTYKKSNLALTLLESEANPNLASQIGQWPLMMAIQNRDEKMVKALLKAKARTDITNKAGLSPLELAQKLQLPTIAAMLTASN